MEIIKIFGYIVLQFCLREVSMKKATCFISMILIVMVVSNACKHKEELEDVLGTPVITPVLTPTLHPQPSNGLDLLPTGEAIITPTITPEVDLEPSAAPTPTKPGNGDPGNEELPKVTPDVEPSITDQPEPTIQPEPTVIISPTTPIPTKGAANEITATPTPISSNESIELDDAKFKEITGSNIGPIIKTQLIENPLQLQKTQEEVVTNLFNVLPELSIYKRVDIESYEWNYYKTTDQVPVVNITSFINTIGKNAREEEMYSVSYGYNSEVSNEAGSIELSLRDGFRTIEEGKGHARKLLQTALPEKYIDVLLRGNNTKVSYESKAIVTNEMVKKAVFKNTPFYIDFYRKEVAASNEVDSKYKPILQVSATTRRSGLLYSSYRDGLVLQDEKFKEFPMDFSNFFLQLDPYHKFSGVKFTKQTSGTDKKNIMYTAEFDGDDLNGESTLISVTMDNLLEDYTISDFHYYTTKTIDIATLSGETTLLSQESTNYSLYLKAAEYYANYLNQIMTLAIYSKDEFLQNQSNDKMTVTKDVTVGAYTIPCSVSISLQKEEKTSNKVTANLTIEYKRR